jgi:glycosyltransferase involved in cell wall biosynthesis
LVAQTDKDLEWLVIDDGSTDNTMNVIDHFAKCQSLFPIRYIYQMHGGKHLAHNLALKEAKGAFLAIVDSDDALTPNALERCWYWWNTLDLDECRRFSGIDGLCARPDMTLAGDPYPKSPMDTNLAEMKFIHKMKGEHWGVVRTDVARRYPFPKVIGFVPEGAVWFEIAKKFQTRAVNEIFRIYY